MRIRIGLGLLASAAPLALVPPAVATPWKSVVPAAAGSQIAQAPESPTRAPTAAVPRMTNPWAPAAKGTGASDTNLAQAAASDASNAERVLLERARYWRARNRPDLAKEALDRLLAADPNNAQALYERGLLAARQGNAAGAQQDLARLRASNPGATRQITELEQAARQGSVSSTEIEQARRLASSGSAEQATRRYQQAFRGTEVPSQYRLEYYQTLAGSQTGYEEGRRGLQELAAGGDPQARLALAKTLTYRENTRRDGIRQLQELTRVPSVSAEATAAWRQALLWSGRGPQDRALYDAYLAARPDDAEIRARREAAVTAAPAAAPRSRATASTSRPTGPSPRAVARIQGFEELNQGDLNDAETRFQQALRLNGSDPDALAGLGIVRLRQDRFAEARDLLGRASRDAGARRRYAEAYDAAYFWAGMEDAEAAFEGGQYDQAEKILNGLIQRNNREGYHARRLLGDVYARQGREDAAERQYQAVLQSQPSDTAALTGLFNLYSAQNRTQDALALAGRIEAAPQSGGAGFESETLRLRAKQYELNGDDNAAFTAYQDAIVADPTNPWLRLDFARFLSRRGEQAQANAMIQSIVDTPGAPPQAMHAAAIYYNEAGMTNESVAVLDRIPAGSQTAEMRALRDRIYFSSQVARARALAEAGTTTEARRILEDLYRAGPNTPERTGEIAAAMADVGDTRRAQSLLRPMITGRNAPVAVQLQYVSVLLKSGQEAEAAAYIRQLEQNASLNSAQRRELAAKSGDLAVIQADRAREARNFADAYDILYPHLAQNPDSPTLLSALARLYATAGYPDEARSIYAAVLERDPRNLDAVRGAVGAAIDAKDYDLASTMIDRALVYHPREPRLYYLLGEVARARGDMSTARQSLQAAQDLRQREIASTLAVNTGGRGQAMPPNPFRNAGRPSAAVPSFGAAPAPRQQESLPTPGPTMTGPVGPNPFRSSLSEVPPAATRTARAAAPAPAASARATGSTGQPAAASAVAARAEEPVEQIASADPTYVSTAQSTRRGRSTARQTAPAPLAEPAPIPQTSNVYVPPFVDPAVRANRPAQDNLTSDIQRSLAAVQKESGPSIGAGLKFRARDGDSGLDRLNEFQAPLDATFSVGGLGKFTLMATPTYLDSGSLGDDPDKQRRFGLNPLIPNPTPAGASLGDGDEDAAGVGFSLAWGNGPFTADVGVTPVGFELVNFVGGVSAAPKLDENIGLRFTAEQRAVTDSLLSYAGSRFNGSDDLAWGGVVRTGGRAELNFDDGLIGAYLNAGYYSVTGTDVEDNDMIEATVGGYYRVIRAADEELRVGVNLTYLSFDKNLRYFTFGHGGYFSPQSYIAFSVPVEYRRTYNRLRYILGGAIGIQNFEEDDAPIFPGEPILPAGGNDTSYDGQNETNLGFNIRGQLEYDVSQRTVLGAAASFDNAADWFEITAGIYLRHYFGGT